MQFHLNILANLILKLYFSNLRCVIIFSDNNDFEYNLEIPFVNVLMINSSFEESVVFQYYGCQGFVINTATPVKSLEYIEQEIRVTLERFNTRKYLFLPTKNMDENVMDVFESKSMEYIADLLVISPIITEDCDKMFLEIINTTVDFELYTHKFVGVNNSNAMVLLDTWYSNISRFGENANLYPDKLTNGFGRLFTTATFEYKPYSVPSVRDGTELQVYLQFCLKHNLSTHIIVDQAGEWGEIFDNWTGYGVVGQVLYDNADMGFCGLCSWLQDHLFLDLSKTMLRTGITCIVPKPQLAGGWLVPLFSFTYEMWIAVAISFVTCILALFLVDLYQIKVRYIKQTGIDKNQTKSHILDESCLHTIAIFLLQPVPDKKLVKDHIKKYIFGAMFVFSLLMTITYDSGLSSSMTVPRYVGVIKTIQDLVDSGIKWGATSNAWITSIVDATGYNYRVIIDRFIETDVDTLRTFNNKRIGFGIERLHAGDFAIGDYVTEEGVSQLRLMTEDIYWEHVVFMTKKSSIWRPALDDFMLLMAQTGIPSYYEYMAATTNLNARIQRAVKYSSHHEDNTGPTKLKWEHVEGAFSLLILGITFATIRFIMELLLDKMHRKKIKKVKKKETKEANECRIIETK